jgi:hypothetical protein
MRRYKLDIYSYQTILAGLHGYILYYTPFISFLDNVYRYRLICKKVPSLAKPNQSFIILYPPTQKKPPPVSRTSAEEGTVSQGEGHNKSTKLRLDKPAPANREKRYISSFSPRQVHHLISPCGDLTLVHEFVGNLARMCIGRHVRQGFCCWCQPTAMYICTHTGRSITTTAIETICTFVLHTLHLDKCHVLYNQVCYSHRRVFLFFLWLHSIVRSPDHQGVETARAMSSGPGRRN